MKREIFSAMLVFSSTSLYAQDSLFEGTFYGVSGVAGTNTIKTTDTTNGDFTNHGQAYQSGQLTLGYGYKISEKVIVQTGLSYQFLNPVINRSLDNAQRTDTEKSHWSVSLEPGYLLRQNTLLHGKLSYHVSELNFHRLFVSGAYSGQTSDATSRFTGFGIGAGVKTEITDNLLIGIDAEVVNYGSKIPFFVRSGGTTSNTVLYAPTANLAKISIIRKF